ncbi:hypothetical protein F8388_024620 [Cannabis sativa]|uniref:MATH domain-containing protein n=1 Tax=Cannabis sativa TaxID=3483 RepID=A0A7J6GC08_CANSA|nr:hypothetical protein F8388_024620 [Cannabis sativa]
MGMKALPRRHQNFAVSPYLRSGKAPANSQPGVNTEAAGANHGQSTDPIFMGISSPDISHSKTKNKGIMLYDSQQADDSVFEAGGYKWQLSFCPNKDKNLLSLYLTIIWCNDDDDESDDIAPSIGWEVNVNFTLFVYNQTKDNYLAFQVVRRFHEMKKEWGFEQIISLETFKDVHNGYVVNDSCVFGAEVFTINQTAPISATLLVQRRFIDNPIFR